MRRGRRESSPDRERGSAVVDFVLVGALVTVLLAAVLQLALALHVRTTLVDCAAEGARVGALLGSSAEAGVERTKYLVGSALSPAYAQDVEASVTDVDGASVLEISVRAPLPVVGLLGPSGVVVASGRAFVES